MVRPTNTFLLLILTSVLLGGNIITRLADYLNTKRSKQLQRANIYYAQEHFRKA